MLGCWCLLAGFQDVAQLGKLVGVIQTHLGERGEGDGECELFLLYHFLSRGHPHTHTLQTDLMLLSDEFGEFTIAPG